MDRIAFSIGPFAIYWYAIFILTGVIIAYITVKLLAKERKMDLSKLDDLIFYGLLFGIIGARLYYVVFNLDFYLSQPIKIFAIRDGGLAIHGGIFAAIIWIIYYTKKHQMNILQVADLAGIGFIIAQAIGRFGNFANQEAHGGEVSRQFLESIHIPEFIINGMYINGVYYHPTFLYESIWNFIGFIFIIIFRNSLLKRPGDIACFYVIWYSFIRFFIEYMRTDSLMLGNIKVAMLVSLLGFILGIAFWIYKNKYLLGDRNEGSNNNLTK